MGLVLVVVIPSSGTSEEKATNRLCRLSLSLRQHHVKMKNFINKRSLKGDFKFFPHQWLFFSSTVAIWDLNASPGVFWVSRSVCSSHWTRHQSHKVLIKKNPDVLSEKMRERRFYNVITEAPNYNYLFFPDISSICFMTLFPQLWSSVHKKKRCCVSFRSEGKKWLHQNGDSL